MSDEFKKVLIVENSMVTADTIEKNLDYMGLQTIAKVTNGIDAISAAKNLEPDMILMDIDLEGRLDGIETSHRIRLFSDIPVIFMSVLIDEKVIQKAAEIGEEIFLCKPFNMQELSHAIEKKMAEAKLKKEEVRNRYLTFHDHLTGLYNRAYFEEELKRYDQKRQLPISIIVADIKALQLTRDVFGDGEGDRLVQDAAELLKRSCRSEDMLARWSGAEFIIFLPLTSEREVEIICERITEMEKEQEDREPLMIRFSLGYSTKKLESESILKVIRKAEEIMQENKLSAQEEGKMNLIQLLEKRLRMETSEEESHMTDLQRVLLQVMPSLNLDERQSDQLMLLAMYHDLGNVMTDKKILNKKEALTDDEWAAIKKHTETGFRIAYHFQDFSPISEYLLTHHEWWNGEGYPQGLRQEEIPLLARIFSITDAISAMMQNRSYRKARSMAEIREELIKMSGKQFDPKLTKIFLNSGLFDQHDDS